MAGPTRNEIVSKTGFAVILWRMKLIQRTLALLLPRSMIERMKRETEQWQLNCKGCGRTKSLWEAGGIRYGKKAVDNYTATLIRCEQCRGLRMAVVERVPEQSLAKGSNGGEETAMLRS
jgi:Fe-S-cluster-containing hydrogenase component 2